MKRYVRAASEVSQSQIVKNLSDKVAAFLRDITDQYRYEYYKQLKRQFTVNGVKYIMKNYSNGKISVTNPEGDELYGYSLGDGRLSQVARDIAISVVNDAYEEGTDLENKKVYLNVRHQYTQYGSNSPGNVVFGEYVDTLRRHADSDKSYYAAYPDRQKYEVGDTSARYAAVLIKAWWSSNDEYILFRNNASELISICKKFIADGANTHDGQGSVGSYQYRFYANVIDTETGEELYFDKSTSYGEE